MNKKLREIIGFVKLFFDRYWLTLTCGMLMFALILQFFTIQKSVMAYASVVNDWGLGFGESGTQPRGNVSSEKLAEYNAYYVGSPQEKTIYLTFDAGYDNGVLEEIIQVLDEKNIKASFFITGDFINRFSDLVIKLEKSGHLLCNHSYSHKSINKMTKDEIKEDIEKLEKTYYDLTKKEIAKYFRPPKGDFDKESLMNVSNLGYKSIFWSMAHFDWDTNKQLSVEKTEKIVLDNLHNGAIILMHSVSISNARSLPNIIDKAIEQGYRFDLLTSL